MSQCVLGIFAKAPVAGQVKTRVAAGTDAEFAARLAEAFVRDVLARYRTLGDERYVVFAPAECRDWFAAASTDAYRLEPQGEGDLGARLMRFFERRAEEPTARVVALGTDSPSLPIAWVRQAFALLAERDVVLGPALDGGYYLIGMRGSFPRVLDIAEWGGPTVFAQTVRRVRESGLRLGLLPPWYDVDTVDDARFLAEHLMAMQVAAEDADIPLTENVLRERFRR